MASRLVVLVSFFAQLCILPASIAGPQSVYDINPRRDWSLTALAVAGIVVPVTLAHKFVQRRFPLDQKEVNPFDRNTIGNHSDTAMTLANVTVVLSVLGPMVADYFDLGFTDDLYDDFVVYIQTLAISGSLVAVTKAISQRPIPRVYSGHADYNDASNYDAFYSGHTTTTVTALSAAAITLNLRHHSKVWPWVLTGAVGTAIGIELVVAGVHYPSDVLVGAAMGIGVGTLIPLLHKKGSPITSNFTLSPLPGGAKALFVKSF